MLGRVLIGSGLIIAIVLLFAVNIFAGTVFSGWRLDLTEHRSFTLSDGTKSSLKALEEPVTIRLYLSQKLATRLPAVSSYTHRVRELLEEYEHVAEGKLVLSVIDPEPFSEAEDRAVGYGLSGIPLQDGESIFYFGLVGTNALDAQEVIPYLSIERSEFLEYDITKFIHTLGNPQRPVVGVISSLNLDGVDPRARVPGRPAPPGNPWVILNQINELFDLRRIPTVTETIPEEVQVLMIVHPVGFGQQTLYAIDQFVLNGGRALVFVDPYPEADTGGQPSVPGLPPPVRPSALGGLLKNWGIDFDTTQAVGDLQIAAQVRTRSLADDRYIQVKYPVWINMPSQLLNQNDIVTGQVGNLTLASPGEIKKEEGAEIEFTPLIQTTQVATKFNTDMLGPFADVEELLRGYTPGGQQLTLAARITAKPGTLKTAFPEGKPQAAGENTNTETKEETESSTLHLSENKATHIIVIGDTDLLQDKFWVQVQDFLGTRLATPTAGNGNLVINALENLMGSEDLIGVRSRGGFLRPFTRVNQLRQEAELKFREKEVELLKRLEQTEQRIAQMDKAKGDTGQSLVLSAAQREEVAQFRGERVRIRAELREVRHALRKNIENLENRIKFINIGLIPILIAIGGFLVSIHRVNRRRRSVRLVKRPA